MAKRAKPEKIIAKLREVEVRLSRGETTGQAFRAIGVIEQRSGEGEPASQEGGLRPDTRQADSYRGRQGKLLSPSRRWACVNRDVDELAVSERRACETLGQHRSIQRKKPRGRSGKKRADKSDHRPGRTIWPLRQSSHHRLDPARRLACEREADRLDLAARRAESSPETTRTRSFMAE